MNRDTSDERSRNDRVETLIPDSFGFYRRLISARSPSLPARGINIAELLSQSR